MLVAELSDVSYRRGTTTILDHVGLSIADGDRWVVIGPNGAGKTTLLSLLAGIAFPSSGTVTLLGQTMGRVDVFDLRPRIGLASPSVTARLPPRERVRDVVLSAAYGFVGRWRESYDETDVRRAEKLLRAWGAGDLADRTFGTLSDGERQRVCVARAIMADPELLLLDEPGDSLDLAGRERLVDSLTRLCRDPKAPATVMVTHHLEEIPPGATHVLLLSHGAVCASGPLEQTLTAENLSRAYEMALRVGHADGRWSARAA